MSVLVYSRPRRQPRPCNPGSGNLHHPPRPPSLIRSLVVAALLAIVGILAACGSDGTNDIDDSDASIDATDAAELDASSAPSDPDASTTPEGPVVRVGVPTDGMESQVELLEDGGDITVRSGGQGGTHAEIAFECEGLGSKVTYLVNIRGLDGEGEVETLPLPRPRPIICDPNGVCRVSPIIVMMGGLSQPGKRTGIEVEVTVSVTSEAGESATGKARGVLQEDLESIAYLLDSGADVANGDASAGDAGVLEANAGDQ